MALTNAKHIINEINGVRCTIIETGISTDRAAFLKDLLEFNGYEVMEAAETAEDQNAEAKYTIGVTDIVFNPVFSVYECLLKTREGGYVTPGYWNQECVECDPRYWLRRKKR